MRHKSKKITLDRAKAGRRALMANLVESLILYGKIKTTKAKARATRSAIEKLITIAKKNNLAARRQISKTLYTKNAVKKLMEVYGPKYNETKGGCTRIITLKNRKGDGAEEAVVEFI